MLRSCYCRLSNILRNIGERVIVPLNMSSSSTGEMIVVSSKKIKLEEQVGSKEEGDNGLQPQDGAELSPVALLEGVSKPKIKIELTDKMKSKVGEAGAQQAKGEESTVGEIEEIGAGDTALDGKVKMENGTSLKSDSPEGVEVTVAATQTDFRTDILRLGSVDDTPTLVVGPPSKRKSVTTVDEPDSAISREIKKAKLETKALKAKRPGFTDERYNETSYYVENGLRKVYPYYFTFTTFTKGRWVGEKILDVFAKEFRAHPVEEYERCIKSGTLTVNYTKVDTDYRLKHNDLLANIVHRHEVPVTSDPIEVVHMDEDLVVVNKPASIPVHPCGRYRHNTVVFILAKEHQLKNLRTIHRLDRLTSGLLLFGRSPKKAREMEQQIRNRLVAKEYVCRVEGTFPDEEIECSEPIEVVSYKIGVCKVSKDGKECRTVFKKLSSNGKTSVVLARPRTGRMHQIRVHLQYLGYPIVNDPLYNHPVFGPEKGKGGLIGKTDEQLIQELISIHNAENWLGIEGEDGGGGGGDIFGSAGAVGVVNDACHLNTASGPSSCTSVQSDNGSSIGSTVGDAGEVIKPECNNASSVHDAVPEVKHEETQVAFPLAKDEKVDAAVNGGKVTVGTQTSDEDSSGVTPTETPTAAQGTPGTGPDCVSSGSQTTPLSSLKCDEGIPKVVHNPTTGDNNNTSVSITKTGRPPGFRTELMTYDPHCYECKVRYRDPKPKDLVMYLHALTYKGPEWSFETKMPAWASDDWIEPDES